MTTATSPDNTTPQLADHQAAAREALDAGLADGAAGRRAEAIRHCHAALRLDPKLSAARDALRDLGEISRLISEGDAANRRRQWPEAARAYAQALAIDPELAAIWVQYGHALKEQGLLDAAETAYRTALGHMPQPDGDIHLQIGHLLKLRGMLPEAREAYLACLGVEPDNPHAKREIAAMLRRRVSRLPEIAPPSTAGGRPYTEVPLAALPGERMRISHQHGLACFTAEGPDPQLELAPDGPGWPLPPGTYGLLFEVADGRGFEGAPTLYIDEGEGYSEAGAVELGPVSAGLWFREFATTAPLRRLRFDPADNAVTFALLRLRLLRFDPPAPAPEAGFAAHATALAEALRGLRAAAGDKQTARRLLRATLQAECPEVIDPGFTALSLGHSGAVTEPRYAEAWQAAFARSEAGHAPDYGARSTTALHHDPAALQVIAFYHTGMQRSAETDAWRALGYTEWADVAKAVPQYLGQLQPRLPGELGFYDQADPATLRRQVALARLYGVHAFCFQHHWFNGQALLAAPLQNLLAEPLLDMPFLLCWEHEPWTRDRDRSARDVLVAQQWVPGQHGAAFLAMLPALLDPRYLQLDGRPLLLLARPAAILDCAAMLALWRRLAVEAGLAGLRILAACGAGLADPAALGLDGVVDNPPEGLDLAPVTLAQAWLNSEHSGQVYDYEQAVAAEIIRLAAAPPSGPPCYPAVMPGFDDEPLRPGRGNSFIGATPVNFHRWFRAAAAHVAAHYPPGQRLVFVNAWNAWGQGAHLEPEARFGYGFLAAIADVVAELVLDATALRDRAARHNQAMPAARSADTVVCLHIFYEDLIEEFAAVIAQAQQRLPLDVIVSLPEAWPLAALERLIAALRPVHILVCRNRGRDVAPFLAALEVVRARGYRHGCKIHSKKSTHLGRGEAWRRALLEGLLGPAALTRLEEGFFADARIGMAGMGEAWLSLAERQNIVHCESRMGEIGALLGLEDAPMRGFFAGTMFWFRPEALAASERLSGQNDLFEPELGQVDGMAAHALERLFAVMVEAAGFTVLKLSLP
jgi:lipopolysaccharide biosynthesis protein